MNEKFLPDDPQLTAYALGELTPAKLGLNVAAYDPEAHAADVKWQAIGF